MALPMYLLCVLWLTGWFCIFQVKSTEQLKEYWWTSITYILICRCIHVRGWIFMLPPKFMLKFQPLTWSYLEVGPLWGDKVQIISWDWDPCDGISDLLERGGEKNLILSPLACTEARLCEDIVRGQSSASQVEGPYQTPNLLALWSWTPQAPELC